MSTCLVPVEEEVVESEPCQGPYGPSSVGKENDKLEHGTPVLIWSKTLK